MPTTLHYKCEVKTSLKVHDCSFPTFGNRFFRTIKYCLYANSVQILTNFSYEPRLVGFVRNVAFGTEDIGLIHPIHDVGIHEGKLHHGLSSVPVWCALPAIRERVDAASYSDYLSGATSVSKLALVVVGHQFTLDGSDLPPNKGATQLKGFTCSSGHCVGSIGPRGALNVYYTISLALQQMDDRLRHFQVGVSAMYSFWMKAKDLNFMKGYYPHDHVSHLVTNLQLVMHASDTELLESGIHDLVENATIDTLEVQFVSNGCYAQDKIQVMHL